ncbi:FtsW/RodA/SpoVE family cell cycle protein [Flavobacterium luminosum]|uniref:Probable peptidoglycan glycosyltransferase FtsW n=1 Tax=Flavobacterium luminosum TaxID=2949086 RepID=A0ABT0TKH8_9FLAO|nr:FtsW/RodA/SpoVE family cell cycle protein [Flavobacterium sp. HXWNR70]MCL9807994.1 putative lipid II flippase FtsW [Flavobacterium sp. HXWNR70]
MKSLVQNLKGDKVIWAMVALLALISFIPVYSASSNLAYQKHGTGNTLVYLIKHLIHISAGIWIMFQVQRIPYHYFRSISRVMLPIAWVLLAYTMFKGTVIDGANASRWISVPFVGITFQPSAFAAIILYLFVGRYLSKTEVEDMTFQKSFIELWIPVFITLALILPANFSTTALIFSMVLMLTFVGNYPIRNSAVIVAMGVLAFAFFVLLAKAFPDAFPNRVDTWISRIENFTSDKEEMDDDDYQIEKAKTAIASGGVYGLGPGKSVQKNFLPQSSSDFIFAIIVEELGLAGAFFIMIIYLILFIRFVIASYKAPTIFGKLVVVGLGFPIIFQAFINMGVAVELLPTTGQTLPLISSGGTSIWMTCAALGIILNVTKKEEEIAQENIEKQQREEALQRLIDRELEEQNRIEEEIDSDYSIEEKVNPMTAVMDK